MHPHRSRLFPLALGLGLTTCVAFGNATSEPARPVEAPLAEPGISQRALADAEQVVETLHEALLRIMRGGDELGFQGRYDHMYGIVNGVYDFRFMARTSIGRQWRTLDEGERRRWIELTRRLSAATYADNFDAYSGEWFEPVRQRPGPRESVRVEVRLHQPDDPAVRFDYRLRESPDGWRVIDVQLDGTVSELALRRADYTSAIERNGFDQLVAKLEEKIARMSTGR